MSDVNFTPLDRDNCALVLIDHQLGLMQFSLSMATERLRQNVLGLADTAVAFDLPTVLTTSWSQGPNGPTMPALRERFPDHPIHERPVVDLWNDDTVRGAIEATGRKKLVMAGISSEVCLTLAATAATRAGYEVYAVMDCSADFTPEITAVTTTRLAACGVQPTTWVPVLAEIARNTVEHGDVIARILRDHVPEYALTFGNFMATAETAGTVAGQIGMERPRPQDEWRAMTDPMKAAVAG